MPIYLHVVSNVTVLNFLTFTPRLIIVNGASENEVDSNRINSLSTMPPEGR